MANEKRGNRITQSKLWQDTFGALGKMWDNYLEILSMSFQRMSRDEQEQLITKYSWIVSIGATAWVWVVVEPLTHSLPIIFLIGGPVSIGLAYWFGRNIVSRVVIDRLNKYMK